MSNSPPSSTPVIGRLTGFVLGSVAFLCIMMIGCAGYLKYELDHAQGLLMAPEASVADEEMISKIRRDLGYSGFIGAAQNYLLSHDPARLADMKADVKEATDFLARLPERSPSDVRHDLQAILSSFSAVANKTNQGSGDAAAFTATDLLPLYAALPVLDARLTSAEASSRREALNHAQFWGMLLTLMSWCSLIIASALTAGIYLTIRDRNSAPLRALTQSVKNMAHGDMRTSIWGMERHDMIGELARAVDMARYQFSQMPDLTLLSDQGPVRLKFEGNTRSMFEAMMKVISRDSEQVHEQTTRLNQSVNQQQETLSLLISRVEAVLQNVERRAVSGDQQVRQALQGMLASAENLKNAQAHAADQLNRIIPYMKDRAHGLSEITQLTGKQVAQVLQSLILAERGLRQSLAGGEEAIRKMSTTASDLGERLFGAVNLLKASGKVLAETTEKTQNRLDEAIKSLGKSAPVRSIEELPTEGRVEPEITPRLETIATMFETTQSQLEATQAQLQNLLAEQTQATRIQIDLLTTHSGGLLTQATTASQTLATSSDRLREQQIKLDEAIGRFATHLNDMASRKQEESFEPGFFKALVQEMRQGFGEVDRRLKEQVEEGSPYALVKLQLGHLSTQVTMVSEKISGLAAQEKVEPSEPAFVPHILLEIKNGFEAVENSLRTTREHMATLSHAASPAGKELSDQIRDCWYQMAAQIEATRTGLASIMTQQVDRIEVHLRGLEASTGTQDYGGDTQHQIEQQTQILAELVTTLGVLDAHMQAIRSQVADIKKAG